jgi:hypothetical protein
MRIDGKLGTVWVAAALWAGAAGAGASPKIVCDEPVFEFGSLDNSEVVEHGFVLRNDGDGTLEIRGAKPSCGCTVADISSKSVAPGEVATILAKLNLHGRDGRQHKTITVESNDPQTPRLMLTMTGEAVAMLSVAPRTLIDPRLKRGETSVHRLTVTSRSEGPLDISSVETGNPGVEAVVEPGETDQHKVVVVTTQGDFPQNMIYGQLVIQTGLSENPTLRVPYRFAVVGEISVYPTEITLLEQTNSVDRILTLAPGMVEEFAIEGVELPAESMESTIQDLKRSRYRITVRNIVASDDLNGKSIKILTTAQNMHEVEIPFRVIRRK